MHDPVVLEFENVVEREGRVYHARAIGAERGDGLWEGWLEFECDDGRLSTERETTQPSRETLKYWATGLTHAYLEGALERASDARSPDQRSGGRGDDPRPHVAQRDHTHVATPAPAHAVLDPFAVYAEGRDLLRDQLGALHGDQLRNIIRRYGISNRRLDLTALTDWEMRALILESVEEQSRR